MGPHVKPQIGLIPGIIRDETRADFWGAMEQVAEIGYEGIEGGANLIEGAVSRNKARLDGLGLQAVTVGASRQQLADDLDRLIDGALALEARHISTWWGPCESADQVRRDAAFYESVGERVAAAGMKFCYHNHDHELLTTFDGVSGLDMLMAETSAEHVSIELDIAWVVYGGDDPVDFITRHPGRFPVIHVKDIADLGERAKFTSVGTGVVDVKGSIEAGMANGVEWFVVEQDAPNNLTPMESVTVSYLNLKEMGFA
jgi:sugar phosphate isomerase/epimerase